MNLEDLKELARRIGDKELREVVLSILENPRLSFTEAKPLITLEESPAAPRKHHFYTGGLVNHTYAVTMLAIEIARLLEEIYGLRINIDLVVATAILHDIFKYYQYIPDNVNGGYRARSDWYLSHEYAVIAEASRRGAPDELIRALSEVHGQTIFSTIEGFIVHLADSVDARIGEFIQNLLLNKAKDTPSTCPVFKVIDELIRVHGIKQLVALANSSPGEYEKLVAGICESKKDEYISQS